MREPGGLLFSLPQINWMIPPARGSRAQSAPKKPAAKCVPSRFTQKSRSHSDLARLDAPRCEIAELSAINRLIEAEEGVPVERRYSFPVGIFTREVKGRLFEFGSWERPTSRAGPPRTRYCLSHFPLPRATSKPIGPRRARISFCAGARFVSRIPLSVTVAGANRLMMHTTIGSGFAAAFAADAARRSRSCRHSRRPTAITA